MNTQEYEEKIKFIPYFTDDCIEYGHMLNCTKEEFEKGEDGALWICTHCKLLVYKNVYKNLMGDAINFCKLKG